MKTKFKIHSGFTLIELLVVIGIIAVLSTVGFTTYQGIQSKARDSVRKNDLNRLATALELYFQKENGRYIPPSTTDPDSCTRDTNAFYATIERLMSDNIVPTDPQTKTKYCYISVNNGQSFRLFAKLENCKDPSLISGIACPAADYNYTINSDDLIASAPPEIPAPTPAPAPSATPTPTSTPPPALAYKRVFVTSTTYNGNLGGVAGADAKCQAAATSPTANLGGTWKAWINGQSSSLPSALSFVLVDRSTVVANNKADLLSGTIRNEINLNENGQIQNTPVWTNTLSNGNIKYTNSINYCNNFTATGSAGSLGGVRGLSSTKAGGWTDADYVGCETSAALYCFEQ